MRLNRTLLLIASALVVWIGVRDSKSAEAQTSRMPEEVGLQREMFTADCPGATEFGSIAITLATEC